jgi:tetratricopeptide (TPR) repeat protein
MLKEHYSGVRDVNLSISLFDANSFSIYILIGAGSVVIASIVIFFMVLSLKNRINPLRRARRQYKKGRYEKALLSLALEIEKNPGNRDALLLKADTENKLERFDDAAKNYYHIIRVKELGDGIDVLTVKKKLLLPLYRIESLLELHTLCGEILKAEGNCPEALYYLSLLYIGQLYFDRASVTLQSLIHNRPKMGEAHFALGLSDAQRGRYAEAISSLNRSLEISVNNLYLLCSAAAYYFKGDYATCSDGLRKIPQRTEAFEKRNQYLFSLRLRAFCNYRLGRYERAVHLLQIVYNLVQQNKSVPGGLYNSRGIVQKQDTEAGESSVFDDYYRLREIAAEEGGVVPPPAHTYGVLDLKGLSRSTEAGIDLCFAMIRAGSLEGARELLSDLRRDHPEVLGLKKLIDLTDEERERMASVKADTPHVVRAKSTERVIRGKGRGFRLWEYMEEWERKAIRPYQLLIIAGFTSRKMLSPNVLFSKGRRGR